MSKYIKRVLFVSCQSFLLFSNEHIIDKNLLKKEVNQEVVQLQPCKKSAVADQVKQICVTSAQLVIPTIVVVSVVMLMFYKPYQHIKQSIDASAQSFKGMKIAFDGMEKSFKEIAESAQKIEHSVDGSKKAFEGMHMVTHTYMHDMKEHFLKSWFSKI